LSERAGGKAHRAQGSLKNRPAGTAADVVREDSEHGATEPSARAVGFSNCPLGSPVTTSAQTYDKLCNICAKQARVTTKTYIYPGLSGCAESIRARIRTQSGTWAPAKFYPEHKQLFLTENLTYQDAHTIANLYR